MNGNSVIATIVGLPTVPRRFVILGFVLLTLPLGSVAILLTPPGTGSAAWWPAAAASVLAVASARGARIYPALLVWAIGIISNYVAGRPLWVAIAFGFANAVEAWVLVRVASDKSGVISFGSMAKAGRFVFAVAVGAGSIGILGGATVAGTGGNFIDSMWAIAASHASAVIVIVPLFILPLWAYRLRVKLELLWQILALAVVVAFVFWPDQIFPYTFLPLPVLFWAAFRFPLGLVVVETFLMAIATTVLTIYTGGPFAAAAIADPVLAIHALQAFIVVMGATGLITGEGRNERERLVAGIAARERVLRSGILASTGGIVVLEGSPAGVLRRAVFNDGAALLFNTQGWDVGGRFSIDEVPRSIRRPVAEILAGNLASWSGSVGANDERTLQIGMTRVEAGTGGFVLTIEVEDVTSRRLAEIADANALRNEKAAVDRLVDLNRQKDDFVSSVSHELRTPVTSIIGYSDELETLDLDDEARGYVATIVRNAHRLKSLIEDLLEVATAVSPENQRAPENVDVDEVLAHVRDDLGTRAIENDVTLVISHKSAAGTLRTVRSDLERIMNNLVSNAVKFTPAAGKVTISATRTNEQLHLRVVDTGVGIPAEDIEKVFTKFFRSKSTSLLPGTGLGLPITKALVEGLGGQIQIISDGETGTEVLVTLPLEWPLFEL